MLRLLAAIQSRGESSLTDRATAVTGHAVVAETLQAQYPCSNHRFQRIVREPSDRSVCHHRHRRGPGAGSRHAADTTARLTIRSIVAATRIIRFTTSEPRRPSKHITAIAVTVNRPRLRPSGENVECTTVNADSHPPPPAVVLLPRALNDWISDVTIDILRRHRNLPMTATRWGRR